MDSKSIGSIDSTTGDHHLQPTGVISLTGTIRCFTTGRLGIWVGMQDGAVSLFSDVDGVELLSYSASDITKTLSEGGGKFPRRPYWCAMHEASICLSSSTSPSKIRKSLSSLSSHSLHDHSSSSTTLWLGMAAGGTTGTGVLVGLALEGDAKAKVQVSQVRVITDHQKGAVRCIKSYGDYLFTSSDDHCIMVRKASDGTPIASLQGHNSWVGCMDITPKLETMESKLETGVLMPQYLWSGAADGLRVWDIAHLSADDKIKIEQVKKISSLEKHLDSCGGVLSIARIGHAQQSGSGRAVEKFVRGRIVASAGDGCVYILLEEDRGKLKKISVFRRSASHVEVSMRTAESCFAIIWAASSSGIKAIKLPVSEEDSTEGDKHKISTLKTPSARVTAISTHRNRLWVCTKQPSSLLAFGGGRLRNTKRRKASMIPSLKKSSSRRAHYASSGSRLPKAIVNPGTFTTKKASITSPSAATRGSRVTATETSQSSIRSDSPSDPGSPVSRLSSRRLHSVPHHESARSTVSTRDNSPASRRPENSPSHIMLVRARNKIKQYQKHVNVLEEKILSQEQDFKQKLKSLSSSVNGAQNGQKTALKRVHEANTKSKKLEQDVKDLRQRLIEKETQIFDFTSQIARLKEEKRRAKGQLALVQRNTSKRSSREARTHEIEKKRTVLLLEDAKKEFEKELGKQERLHALKVEQLESDNKELRSQTARLHQQLANHIQDASKSGTEDELSAVKKDKERIARQAKESQAQLLGELASTKERLVNSETKLQEVQTTMGNLMDEHKSKIDTMRKSIRADAEKHQQEMRNQQESMQAKLREEKQRARAEIDKLQGEILNLKRKGKEEKTAMVNEKRSLESELEQQRKHLETQHASEKVKMNLAFKEEIEAIKNEYAANIATKDEQLRVAEATARQMYHKKQELTKDLEKSMLKVTSESANTAKVNEENKILLEEKNKLSRELIEAKSALEILQKHVQNIEKEKGQEEEVRAKLENILGEQGEKEEILHEELEENEKAIAGLKSSIEKYREGAQEDKLKIDELSQTVRYTNEKLVYAQKMLEAKDRALRTLANEHDTVRDQHSEAVDMSREHKAKAEAEIRALKLRIESLQSNEREKSEENEKSKTLVLQRMQEENNELHHELEQKTLNLLEMQKKLRDMRMLQTHMDVHVGPDAKSPKANMPFLFSRSSLKAEADLPHGECKQQENSKARAPKPRFKQTASLASIFSEGTSLCETEMEDEAAKVPFNAIFEEMKERHIKEVNEFQEKCRALESELENERVAAAQQAELKKESDAALETLRHQMMKDSEISQKKADDVAREAKETLAKLDNAQKEIKAADAKLAALEAEKKRKEVLLGKYIEVLKSTGPKLKAAQEAETNYGKAKEKIKDLERRLSDALTAANSEKYHGNPNGEDEGTLNENDGSRVEKAMANGHVKALIEHAIEERDQATKKLLDIQEKHRVMTKDNEDMKLFIKHLNDAKLKAESKNRSLHSTVSGLQRELKKSKLKQLVSPTTPGKEDHLLRSPTTTSPLASPYQSNPVSPNSATLSLFSPNNGQDNEKLRQDYDRTKTLLASYVKALKILQIKLAKESQEKEKYRAQLEKKALS